MDIAMLAKEAAALLIPLLPYLLKAGEGAADEAGKHAAGATWDHVKMLWGKLRPKVEANPAARNAVQQVIARPQDERVQGTLALQLEDVFSQDTGLATELERLLREIKPHSGTVVQANNRSVAAGGNITGSTIITGDQKLVQPGLHNERE